MNKIIVVVIALLIALPACGQSPCEKPADHLEVAELIVRDVCGDPIEAQLLRRIVQIEKEHIELRQKLDELEQKLIEEHLNIIKQSVGSAK